MLKKMTENTFPMAKRIIIHSFIGFTLLSASCSQDNMVDIDANDSGGKKIEFRASLPELISRATELNNSSIDNIQVSAFTVGASALTCYFFDKPFAGTPTGSFISSDPDCVWPNNNDLIRFVTFSPSCEYMRTNGGFDDTHFTLTSLTAGQNLTSEGYHLSGFRIPRDIASHFDFVTALSSGRLLTDEETGVDLAFRHQLSRIELKAWGESPSYGLEIAGVRLGTVGVGGEFSFPVENDAADVSSAGSWTSVTKGNVEYIFREGDKIVKLDRHTGSHSSVTDAAYLLRAKVAGEEGADGRDNSAMVIPANNEAWQYKDNPENAAGEDKAAGMYISVLLRISDTTSGDTERLFYPSDPIPEKMNAMYFAVDSENTVKTQLYKQGDKYFTDSAHTTEYDPEANSAEVKAFGWAAFPVSTEWKPGLIYTYTLNYTAGVGLHDPEDPDPGTPIISDGLVFNVEINKWERTDDKDVTVPIK